MLIRLVLVWILLELIGAAQVRHAAGGTRLTAWIRTLGTPVVELADEISVALEDGIRATAGATRLELENRRLKGELERLSAFTLLLEDDLAAAREAAALVALAGEQEGAPIVGRVAYRDASAGRMELRLPAPRPVPVDAPAIAAGGVLGRVVAADRRRCWLELVTHPASAVAVRGEGGDFDGLAIGGSSGELSIEFVPRIAKVLRGDLLVTSGADGIYPPGLPVARITVVQESDAPFLTVQAMPTADPMSVHVALLLVAWPAGPEGADR